MGRQSLLDRLLVTDDRLAGVEHTQHRPARLGETQGWILPKSVQDGGKVRDRCDRRLRRDRAADLELLTRRGMPRLPGTPSGDRTLTAADSVAHVRRGGGRDSGLPSDPPKGGVRIVCDHLRRTLSADGAVDRAGPSVPADPDGRLRYEAGRLPSQRGDLLG